MLSMLKEKPGVKNRFTHFRFHFRMPLVKAVRKAASVGVQEKKNDDVLIKTIITISRIFLLTQM